MKTYVSLSAVGDITLGDHPLCVGFGVYSKFKNLPPDYPFEHVLDAFKNKDIVFGNLECTHSCHGLRRNKLNSVQMRGYPRQVEGLVKAGFNMFNLANNHSMQHGKEAFLDTMKLLKDHNIRFCGVNTENHLIGQPSIIEVNGIKIAFLGYSLRPRQYFNDKPFYSEGYLDRIIKDVEDNKQRVDIVVTSLHWGEEFIERPSLEEIKMARKIIESGADLIIGHHPHVLRGIENYKHGIIVYSLGNFVCDMSWDERLRESLIFNCRITKSGISDFELTPIYINDNYQPEVLTEDRGKELLQRIDKLTKELSRETLTRFDEKSKEYQRDAYGVLQRYRIKSQKYFLANLRRYPVLILLQQIGNYVKPRISGLVNKKTV